MVFGAEDGVNDVNAAAGRSSELLAVEVPDPGLVVLFAVGLDVVELESREISVVVLVVGVTVGSDLLTRPLMICYKSDKMQRQP